MGVFGDLNKVEIIGNITQDIDLRYTANGSAVTNFSIATNRSYKLGEEWKDEVSFHNIVVWANDAEQLGQRAKKGTRIYVQGRLQTRSWDDQEGKKQYRTEIIAERIILLDRYEKGGDDSNAGGYSAPKSQGAPSAKPAFSKPVAKAAPQKSNDEDIIDPDDLPF